MAVVQVAFVAVRSKFCNTTLLSFLLKLRVRIELVVSTSISKITFPCTIKSLLHHLYPLSLHFWLFLFFLFRFLSLFYHWLGSPTDARNQQPSSWCSSWSYPTAQSLTILCSFLFQSSVMREEPRMEPLYCRLNTWKVVLLTPFMTLFLKMGSLPRRARLRNSHAIFGTQAGLVTIVLKTMS